MSNDQVQFVECPNCHNVQADMGTGVACEECGELMPTALGKETRRGNADTKVT